MVDVVVFGLVVDLFVGIGGGVGDGDVLVDLD